jgi:hypothetical protein
MLRFFSYCAYYMDYHWDRHRYFVILSLMHRLDTLLLTCSTPVMTRSYYRYYEYSDYDFILLR